MAFGNCTALQSVALPEGTVSLGGYVFDGCSALTSVTLPESLTEVGRRPFRNCGRIALHGHVYSKALIAELKKDDELMRAVAEDYLLNGLGDCPMPEKTIQSLLRSVKGYPVFFDFCLKANSVAALDRFFCRAQESHAGAV